MITDGRFSGATRGPCVGHISPEAWEGGPLAAVENGDIITIDLKNRIIHLDVPDEVINKPGKLTDEEFAKIKKHPEKGSQILEKITEMPKLKIGARRHHEHYDGSGYTDGPAGEDIPEEARIIAVADAYDAMTSHRSYRGMLEQAVVRKEIENGKGTQFDPVFADIMLAMIDEDKDYNMKES